MVLTSSPYISYIQFLENSICKLSMQENSLILKHAIYNYNNHIYDTVLVFVITRHSAFKSAGYRNCTRSVKIVYLKVDF